MILASDTDFQASFNGFHVGGPVADVPNPGDGPDIGPDAPTEPYRPTAVANGALMSVIESVPAAGKFPTVMTYYDRPVLVPNATRLRIEFDAWVDAGIKDANAFETDTMLVRAGATPQTNQRLNLSVQNVAGVLYLIQKGQWVPFATPGLFQPGKLYHHAIQYALTPTGGGILSLAINDTTYAVPAGLQVADVALVPWPVLAIAQVQQSLKPDGKHFGVLVDHLSYYWG